MIIYLIYPLMVFLTYYVIKEVYKEEHEAEPHPIVKVFMWIFSLFTFGAIFLVFAFYTLKNTKYEEPTK